MSTADRLPPVAKAPLSRVLVYGRLVRFSHTVFALPFAAMGLFLAAGGWPGWGRLGLILLCMVTARSAAMAFNRIADVRLDARNPRTARRPLQTGELTLRQAWAFYAACAAGFLAGCAGFLAFYGNPWPIALALPVLALLTGYSLAKRCTWASHLLLGAALGAAPAAAWLAVAPQTFGAAPLVLGAAVVCWVAGFDILYALQDIEIDRAEGLQSVPARFGAAGALWISRGLHAVTAALLVTVGLLAARLGCIYFTGVTLAAVLLTAQQAIVSPRDTTRAPIAFFHANALLSLLLAAACIADVFVE